MCYLSNDLSLNVGETIYTIKGKEFIFLRSTLKSLFYKKTFFQIKTEPFTTIHSDYKFFFKAQDIAIIMLYCVRFQ